MSTKKDKAQLLKAVEQAKGFRECRYLDENDEPYCVIGQLASLEGVPAETIKAWKQHTIRKVRPITLSLKYSIELLIDMQTIWDGFMVSRGDYCWSVQTEEEAREVLRKLIDLYYEANP